MTLLLSNPTIFLVNFLFEAESLSKDETLIKENKNEDVLQKSSANSSINIESICFFISLSFLFALLSKLENLGYVPDSKDILNILTNGENLLPLYDGNFHFKKLNLNLMPNECYTVEGIQETFNLLYKTVKPRYLIYDVLELHKPAYSIACEDLHNFLLEVIKLNNPEVSGSIKRLLLEISLKIPILSGYGHRNIAWFLVKELIFYALPYWQEKGMLANDNVNLVVSSDHFKSIHPLYSAVLKNYIYNI